VVIADKMKHCAMENSNTHTTLNFDCVDGSVSLIADGKSQLFGIHLDL